MAQELISTAGDVQESENAQLSYSIGEPVTETLTGSAILTQGFQQADLLTTEVTEWDDEQHFALYPNPCSDQLFLKASESGAYEIEIFDLSGRNVLSQQAEFSTLSVLEVSRLNSGMYVIQIRSDGADQPRVLQFQKVE